MFDNSLYSNSALHRKLQQALAQVLRKLGSAKGVIEMFPNRQRTNKKKFSLQKILQYIKHTEKKIISTKEKHFGRFTEQNMDGFITKGTK